MGSSGSLEDEPTWAVGAVFFVIISVSLLTHHLIHLLSNWLKRHRHTSLFEAVQKLKSGLLVLGLMSLSLRVIQRSVSRICIPHAVAYSMLPCSQTQLPLITKPTFPPLNLLITHCQSQGKESLISEEGMNQLSIFIFVLAVMHILSSLLTIALAKAKILIDSDLLEKPHLDDDTRILVQVHALNYGSNASSGNSSIHWQKLTTLLYAMALYRPVMWIVMVIFMLLNVHGWHEYIWVSFLPLVIVVVVGTKMEEIVENMALKVKEKGITKGTPLVQPNDAFFWFGHPKHILTLLHFILFMNAFEAAFLTWVTMGSELKSGVVREKIGMILKQWHADVRKKRLEHEHEQQQCDEMETTTNNIAP
ncbi:MLO-like protein 3 [Senna tora]|uniref:MLO-like protein 3 n=1 Tax=Senna tora TaxID=362788 RepID=A0A834SN22_9FABA|nr:MLO-like protein 3 [Senna tora]